MLKAVVLQALGSSSGSEILIFKRFRNAWINIDKNNFSPIFNDSSALKDIANVSTNVISVGQKKLNQYQPRDDYKELLNLTIIFLGGVPEKRISFRASAELYRARWMVKAIYAFKIFLFCI